MFKNALKTRTIRLRWPPRQRQTAGSLVVIPIVQVNYTTSDDNGNEA